jgi:hypothetical protein
VVGFYFGARELHYLRRPRVPSFRDRDRPDAEEDNPALSDWRTGR